MMCVHVCICYYYYTVCTTVVYCLPRRRVWLSKSCLFSIALTFSPLGKMSSFEGKKVVIGGNWKCNGTAAQVDSLIASLNGVGDIPINAEVVIAAPSLFLRHCREHLRSDIHTSSQDIGLNSGFGAYTGEISDALLLDSGIGWCLAGHSERRVGFGYPVRILMSMHHYD